MTLWQIGVTIALIGCGACFFAGPRRVAFVFALLGCGACFWVGLHNATPLSASSYVYFLLPLGFVLLPQRWPRRSMAILAAVLLLIYVCLPWSFSIGMFFWPAALFMVLATVWPSHENGGRAIPQ
jgi:hypothetical protein